MQRFYPPSELQPRQEEGVGRCELPYCGELARNTQTALQEQKPQPHCVLKAIYSTLYMGPGLSVEENFPAQILVCDQDLLAIQIDILLDRAHSQDIPSLGGRSPFTALHSTAF